VANHALALVGKALLAAVSTMAVMLAVVLLVTTAYVRGPEVSLS